MKASFSEKQNFIQPWLYIPLGIAWIVLVAKYFELEKIDNAFLIAVGGVGLITLVVFLLRLETKVDREGISYRWFPFQPSFTRIPWRRIERVEVKQYAPIAEFGGWGIRWTFTRTALNTKGNSGFEIFFKDKKRSLLIGTQKPDEVAKVVEEITILPT